MWSRLSGSLPRDPEVVRKIAARVKERNSWSNWSDKTLKDVAKFVGVSPPKLPSQKQMDEEFPVQSINWDLLSKGNVDTSKTSVTWIGHATCLLQLNGYNILTDPMFSYRCSASQYVGPARYRSPPCTVQELVSKLQLDAVVVSHNHYDHLDYNSIQDLVKYSGKPLVFVVPLGLKDWFHDNINLSQNGHSVVELDWHESHSVKDTSLTVTALPMQHWSSRRGYDRDKTLWCGFSITSGDESKKALFTGDTGWFEGVHDIGRDYGPFQVAMIPIGAYEPRDFMKPQHINPHEAVQMMKAFQSKFAVPIHWGTFQLTWEGYLEPREHLQKSLEDAKIPTETFPSWSIGETVVFD